MNRQNKNKLSVKQRIERHNRAMNGDAAALMECSYDIGICTRGQLDDFFRIQQWCNETEGKEVD